MSRRVYESGAYQLFAVLVLSDMVVLVAIERWTVDFRARYQHDAVGLVFSYTRLVEGDNLMLRQLLVLARWKSGKVLRQYRFLPLL
jgi:hypothetical protein